MQSFSETSLQCHWLTSTKYFPAGGDLVRRIYCGHFLLHKSLSWNSWGLYQAQYLFPLKFLGCNSKAGYKSSVPPDKDSTLGKTSPLGIIVVCLYPDWHTSARPSIRPVLHGQGPGSLGTIHCARISRKAKAKAFHKRHWIIIIMIIIINMATAFDSPRWLFIIFDLPSLLV